MYRLSYYRDPETLASTLYGKPIDALAMDERRLLFAIATNRAFSTAMAETARDLDEATTIEALVGIRDGIQPTDGLVGLLGIDGLGDALRRTIVRAAARKLLNAKIDASPILAETAGEHDEIGPTATPGVMRRHTDDVTLASWMLDYASMGLANRLTRAGLRAKLEALSRGLTDHELPPLHDPAQRRTDAAIRDTEGKIRAAHRAGLRISYKRAYYHARAAALATLGAERIWEATA